MRIPCITLYNPWAYWIAMGWKKIETRFHTRFQYLEGKRIGIHVGKRWDNDARFDFLSHEQLLLTNTQALGYTGAVICTAFAEKFGECKGADSKDAMIDCRNFKRYGLWLRDIRMVVPKLSVKGSQGIFMVEVPDAFAI